MSVGDRTRISVVITTFNYERFIRDAIESVLAQTRLPDEIVVIDDGSTDRTEEVVRPFEERGVRYIVQQNAGAGAARNRGIEETTGELIAFLDADDMWLPRKLEQQERLINVNPDVVLVTGHMVWWNVVHERRHIEKFGDVSPARLRREMVVRNVIGNPSMVLVRRSAIERAGAFDPRLRWGQDWEFFIRLTRYGCVETVPEPVIIYRSHGDSLSRQKWDERLSTLHGIHRRAITRHQPVWQRAPLRARMWSAIEFDRTRMSIRHTNRKRVIARAALAFISYPFDHGFDKLTFVFRAIIGERRYRSVATALRGVHLAIARRGLGRS